MDNHTTSDSSEEISLHSYNWDNFSFFDTTKHKIHLFFTWMFCRLFGIHDWNVLITPWAFSDIKTLQDFQKYRANKFKCSCCGLVKHNNEVTLNAAEKIGYNFHTRRYFKTNT